MIKLKYLTKTVEIYKVQDPKTKAEFEVVVTESPKGIYYEIALDGCMFSDGINQCIELLQELVQVDCYNSVVRKGEKDGKKEFKVPNNSLGTLNLAELAKSKDSVSETIDTLMKKRLIKKGKQNG
jgi:hypothetical protein